VANKFFDYMLKKYQNDTKVSRIAWFAPIEMDNAISDDTWDNDESPLMQAWDEV
jgi:hypothetical protein